MSRHVLALLGTSQGHLIVGYDRPTKAFFCQLWKSDTDDYPAYEDDCFEIDHLESLGAVVPEGLREILVKEAAGDIDPNYVKDWRPCRST